MARCADVQFFPAIVTNNPQPHNDADPLALRFADLGDVQPGDRIVATARLPFEAIARCIDQPDAIGIHITVYAWRARRVRRIVPGPTGDQVVIDGRVSALRSMLVLIEPAAR